MQPLKQASSKETQDFTTWRSLTLWELPGIAENCLSSNQLLEVCSGLLEH